PLGREGVALLTRPDGSETGHLDGRILGAAVDQADELLAGANLRHRRRGRPGGARSREQACRHDERCDSGGFSRSQGSLLRPQRAEWRPHSYQAEITEMRRDSDSEVNTAGRKGEGFASGAGPEAAAA